MHLNVPLAKAYARELTRLSKQLNLPGPVTLDQLARAPGVFQTDEQIAEEEDFWPVSRKSIEKGAEPDVQMRVREGIHLGQDLAERIAIMRKATAHIQANAPKVAKRYRQQLIDRIKGAGLEAPVLEDERLLKEVVYFADRSEIFRKSFRDCRVISSNSTPAENPKTVGRTS